MPIWVMVLIITIFVIPVADGYLPEHRYQKIHYALQALALGGLVYEAVIGVIFLYSLLGLAGISGLTAFATLSCMCFFL